MNDAATGESAPIMLLRSLSAMAAKTIGNGGQPVSCEIRRQRRGPGRVVRRIDQQIAVRRHVQPFEPRRPLALCQARDDRLGRHVRDDRRPPLENRDRHCGVVQLMTSG